MTRLSRVTASIGAILTLTVACGVEVSGPTAMSPPTVTASPVTPGQGCRNPHIGEPTLKSGWCLRPFDSLYSPAYRYMLRFEVDGNLVLYRMSAFKQVWSTAAPDGNHPGRAEMRPDGDLVLSNAQGNKLWSTGTGRCPGHGVSLHVADDGDLVLMTADRQPVWSRLGHHPAAKCPKR